MPATVACFSAETEQAEELLQELPPDAGADLWEPVLKLGAATNHAAIIHMLGRVFLEDGDFAGAAPWFERGVRLGDYQAMQDLGVMWLKGEGRDIDLARAYAYFRLEAEIIPRSDDYYVPRPDLLRILKMPDALKARLSPQQIEDGERHFSALKDSMTCRWNEWYWKHAAGAADRIRQRKQPTN